MNDAAPFLPPPATVPAVPAGARRNVLLLQSLMGPFFHRLGRGLSAAGHRVFKVNFNGGDRLYWMRRGGIEYRGTLAEWPQAFAAMLERHAIEDVMLFGDCRDHHAAALTICRAQGIRVWVFEEGYVRPDWVTMELGGVNAHSQLPRDPAWYLSEAAALPPIPEHRQVPSSFRRRAQEGVAYNVADVLTRWHYPGWTTHRPWHPAVEGVGWARKLMQGRRKREDGAALIARLVEGDAPFYLFPLQLDSDAQIRLHSPFAGIAEALNLVLSSFAAHAPAGSRLVVKEHPLDNGVRDWSLITADLAARYGVDERVDYLPWGDIDIVTRRARGVVTINSTSGTLALARGVPVAVLGSAIYDMAGLTHQRGLDAFWGAPEAPDGETFAAFRRVLIDRCLIPGGFFSEAALEKVVTHAVARFEGRRLLPD